MLRALSPGALWLLVPIGIGAQSPASFATEITVSGGAYQHGNPLDEWGHAVQLAVRQNLWGAFFVEGEWSRVDARWPIVVPVGGDDPNPSFGLAQSYASLGAGLQWPTLSVVRPYAGLGIGKMFNESESLSAWSYFVGASFTVWSRVRPRVEYRVRREMTSANYPYPRSTAVLAGISLLFGT